MGKKKHKSKVESRSRPESREGTSALSSREDSRSESLESSETHGGSRPLSRGSTAGSPFRPDVGITTSLTATIADLRLSSSSDNERERAKGIPKGSASSDNVYNNGSATATGQAASASTDGTFVTAHSSATDSPEPPASSLLSDRFIKIASKAEYLAMQNKLFESITGVSTYKTWRRNHIDTNPSLNEDLIRVLQMKLSSLDNEIYNEVNDEKQIEKELIRSAKNFVRDFESQPSDKIKLMFLYDCVCDMRKELAHMEWELVKSRRSLALVDKQRQEMRKVVQSEISQRMDAERETLALSENLRDLQNKLESIRDSHYQSGAVADVSKTLKNMANMLNESLESERYKQSDANKL